MGQSNNALFDATIDLQKKWSESVTELTKILSGMGVDTGKNDSYAGAKVWNEAMRQVLEHGFDATKGASRLQTAMQVILKAASISNTLMGLADKLSNGLKSGTRAADAAEKVKHYAEKVMQWPAGKMPESVVPESVQAWQGVFMHSIANGTDFLRRLAKRATEGIEKDLSKSPGMSNFYSFWLSRYERTVGRFVNITTVGPSRYEAEKLEKNTDAYVRYQAASVDFQSKMVQTGIEAIQEIAKESAGILADEVSEQSLEKLHNMLMSVGERRFHELFKSEFFCQSLESLVSTGLDLLKSCNDLTEDILRNTPIVTQTQADQIHHEVYLLKKRVVTLESRLVGKG